MNFYLVGNAYIFVLFMLAILSNIEMDKRFHKKYNKCDERDYDKYGFHFLFIYNAENIIPGMMILVIVKYEIGVASNHAKRLGDVGSFNRVGFIIVPIYVLKAQVDGCVDIIVRLNICEVAHCTLMGRRRILIYYKHTLAIEVGKFRSFFADEIHFSGCKVGWWNKPKWSHCWRGYLV